MGLASAARGISRVGNGAERRFERAFLAADDLGIYRVRGEAERLAALCHGHRILCAGTSIKAGGGDAAVVVTAAGLLAVGTPGCVDGAGADKKRKFLCSLCRC